MTLESAQADSAAIDRVLSGDREAFAVLVRAHAPRVRSLCLSLLRNPAEADDAAQEVFLKAFRGLRSFRRESSVSTWLYRIAHRHCIDMIRSAGRRRAESLDAWEVDILPAPPSPFASTAEVQSLLGLLTFEEREVLTLREVQGLSYDELGDVLGCSLDGVKGRLKRARQSLREKARHLFDAPGVQTMETKP